MKKSELSQWKALALKNPLMSGEARMAIAALVAEVERCHERIDELEGK